MHREDPQPSLGAPDPLLVAEAVHKWYDGSHVLRGVDLSVSRGEIVCLIGPSGSGKTTFLRCINHLEARDGGTITIGGEPVGYEVRKGILYHRRETDLARMRRRCGMVFQSFNLFPHMTALENVAYGQQRVLKLARREARERALALLTRVGLADKTGEYPARLSGGQQQRVAIARAVAMSPELMLFDEPTSALDRELVGEVLGVIRDLAENDGMTMVIVTHELAFAAEIADWVVFMDHGLVVERGPARRVLESPSNPRTAAFLGLAQTANDRVPVEGGPMILKGGGY
jgi:polar amino acid transport system ATP-binding protein